MRDLVKLAREALELGEPCVLCTVVRLEGSGYGQPGSRLLVTQSGERSGYISGGCLEKDLLRQVWSRTTHGPALLAFDTRGDSVSSSRYQTGCEGIVYVLCQRIESANSPAYQVMVESQLQGRSLRIGTVYRSESADVRVGHIWVERPRTEVCVDSMPYPLRERLTAAKANQTIEFLGSDGGTIEVAMEILIPPKELLIFGAGDDVIPLVAAANLQGWNVSVTGHRPELVTSVRFPGATVFCRPWDDATRALSIRSDTNVLMMTHDLEADFRLLPQLLESPSRSIGILGPKRRLGRLIQSLYRRGRAISAQEAERIRSPIGLDIGAATPTEVAASIIAELIALTNCREGGKLHNRSHPLHDRAEHEVLNPGKGQVHISEILPLTSPIQAESCPLD
ncbi:XdhC family protein [Bremerella alba]|uniref:Putative xanthine dehydrogenase subunit A n=1 Tax=Bremerella alba TaxID=980252 RepID=A0A7V8V298_9BACT|nr:XdhC/CoxI family protein [Bremerella alba]MBA2113594.1 putative xanthine dehydrogenase subunit A [Bremerella alba]